MTAVEYLISMVKSPEWQDMYIWHKEEVFKTALAMEKEQMKEFFHEADSYSCSCYDSPTDKDFEEYYNKNYGRKSN